MTSLFPRLFSRISRFSSVRRLSDSGLRTSDSDKRKAAGGFTLIELLIVIAIIGVLVSLLAGGIKASAENAKKRQRATELETLESAIMTYWHDTGKPPISPKTGQYTYTFQSNNNEVFAKLINEKSNALGKKYLDINQLRTADENKHVHRMEKSTEPLADYKGTFYKVTINLKNKTAKVE